MPGSRMPLYADWPKMAHCCAKHLKSH
uniref:Uncharacterized protein n=1 Tax=Anguilla anguilla TaxID=7936 RepID=A0A0E9U0X3_ANGAN